MAEIRPALAALGVAQVLATAKVERIGHELSAAVPAIASTERFTCRSW
ncbi:hypothetical protein OG992_00525 [Micromonospora sp. NBC_00362]|nr:hypothetical protein [Micromonospora sp. NBC_00362]MCX5115644.1 hypothetical protein [Micromonospora sp. NBC_00362]